MSRVIFHLMCKLERLENTSSYSEQLHQADYIFKTAVGAIDAAVRGGFIAALLGVLERLSLSHPQPVEVIRLVSILLSKTEMGFGLKGDLERQFVHLQRGSESEDPQCVYMLGCSYFWGRGTSVDIIKAQVQFRRLYEKEIPCIESVRFDSGLALSYALLHVNNRTALKIREAISILLDIRHNEATATCAIWELGNIFRFGLDNVPAEPTNAWNIYREAMRLPDNGIFLHEMGLMAESGEGLPEPDLFLAEMYYTCSIRRGFFPAEESLEVLRRFSGQTNFN